MARKKSRNSSESPIKASLHLQIGVCLLLSIVFVYGVFLGWLAHEPYSTFIEFISSWKTVGTVLGFLSAIATAWAFVLGWDPKTKLFEKISSHVFAPLMRHRAALLVACGASVLLLVAETALAVHLLRPMPTEIEASLYGEYDAAEATLKALPAHDSRKAFFLAFNESLLQEQLRTSASASLLTCQKQMELMRSDTPLLEPLYQRYLRHRAQSACYWVGRNPAQSLRELDKMMGTARFLGPTELGRARLAKATVYLGAGPTELGLKDEKETRQSVLNTLSQIELPSEATDTQLALRIAGLRLQGNVAFLNRNFGEANEIWSQALQLLPQSREGPHQVFLLEAIRLRGNRVLSLGAAGLIKEALAEVGQAEPAIDAFLKHDTDSHRTTAIRVYSNGSVIAGANGECAPAELWWARREKIKKQERSACTALLETIILSCGASAPAKPELKRSLLQDLAFAVAGKAGADLPAAGAPQARLLEAGATRFGSCYTGLVYPKDQVATALGLPAP